MKKHVFFIAIVLAAMAVGGLALIVGYRFINQYVDTGEKITEPVQQENKSEISNFNINPAPNRVAIATTEYPPLTSTETDVERIQEDTKIIFEYRYEDGSIKSSSEESQYFLLGKTRESLAETFDDWVVMEFSSEKVVLRKDAEVDVRPHYIVGIKDGYVAVYHNTGGGVNNLKEITDTPVGALTAEERQRLNSGINIYNEADLFKVLEDYGS